MISVQPQYQIGTGVEVPGSLLRDREALDRETNRSNQWRVTLKQNVQRLDSTLSILKSTQRTQTIALLQSVYIPIASSEIKNTERVSLHHAKSLQNA